MTLTGYRCDGQDCDVEGNDPPAAVQHNSRLKHLCGDCFDEYFEHGTEAVFADV